MVFYSFLAGLDLNKNENWLMPVVIVGMLIGYFLAYVFSPHDILWHLETSCNRLFLQLWPAAIFAFFVMASFDDKSHPVEEQLSAQEETQLIQ